MPFSQKVADLDNCTHAVEAKVSVCSSKRKEDFCSCFGTHVRSVPRKEW